MREGGPEMNSQVCVHAERDEYRRVLASLAYPASKAAILRKALDIGGIDTEVVKAVRLLPDRPFGSEKELQSFLHSLYVEHGVMPEEAPV
jgi:hypothetical protein